MEHHIEPTTRKLIGSCNGTTSFTKEWHLLGSRFPYLVKFCGGVATILPVTPIYKSDFSILRWENYPFRKCLVDFFLRGFIQENHYERLEDTIVVEKNAPKFVVE